MDFDAKAREIAEELIRLPSSANAENMIAAALKEAYRLGYEDCAQTFENMDPPLADWVRERAPK